MASFQASWKLNFQGDEQSILENAKNFNNCPALPADYLFSVRFRKIINSLKEMKMDERSED